MATTKENVFVLTPFNFKDGKTEPSFSTKSVNMSQYVDKYDPLIFCRTCANIDPCLVPIFKGEGLDYSLDKKIEKYLPIQVSEEDDLPVHLCYHCASTLIAWDTLLIGCIEAEKKLNLLKESLDSKQCVEEVNEKVVEDMEGIINGDIDSDDEPLISKKASVNIRKNDEKRDILLEKNDLQSSLEPGGTESERLMEEPDLSFSTYQHQFTMHRPFVFEILNVRIENSSCCNVCSSVSNLKLNFLKSVTKLKHQSVSDSGILKNQNSYDSFVGTDIVARKLKRHKDLKAERRVVCENCGKVLSCKLSLKNHMKTHFNEKTLTCDVCGKSFTHRFNLLRHLRVVHEGVRNHVCLDCGKRYRSRGEMEDHRNIHDVQQKIICEECGRIFLTKASFYPHKQTHRTVKNKKEVVQNSCKECHKKFTTKKSRNQHMLIHTGEKPINCTVCGKNFRTKANFSQHAKIHSDVKPFGCEYCGKAFARKDHWRIHVRCHTGEKPFVCNFCGRAFTQMNDMKKHSRTHEKSGKD